MICHLGVSKLTRTREYELPVQAIFYIRMYVYTVYTNLEQLCAGDVPRCARECGSEAFLCGKGRTPHPSPFIVTVSTKRVMRCGVMAIYNIDRWLQFIYCFIQTNHLYRVLKSSYL